MSGWVWVIVVIVAVLVVGAVIYFVTHKQDDTRGRNPRSPRNRMAAPQGSRGHRQGQGSSAHNGPGEHSGHADTDRVAGSHGGPEQTGRHGRPPTSDGTDGPDEGTHHPRH